MGSERERAGRPPPASARAQKRSPAEDFAYKVELWDEDRKAVEQVLAVATSAAIAHAAFYAAAREYGERGVTLKHKGNIINRWKFPSH
ncbi:MAG TPA: hypothetical protein VHT03_03090 [Rhizomicrobium sp.]|jgi:hypothetical protein|nr:hypothetical protein [Rhizomicrobium sp.]